VEAKVGKARIAETKGRRIERESRKEDRKNNRREKRKSRNS